MKRLVLAFLFVVMGSTAALAVQFNIVVDPGAENCVKHGADVLLNKMKSAGIEVKITEAPARAPGEGEIILLDASASGEAAAIAESAGIEIPDVPESYVTASLNGGLIGAGRDPVGAMYAAYDLAEQFEINGPDHADIKFRSGIPSMELRAVNPFFHVEAFNDPNSWYYDEEFWKSYLDELSWDRYNLLDIHAMYELISTFFPNCYLYLLKSDKFPDVGIDAERARKNLEAFNRIISLAKDRGIRVSLMSYHASWHLTSADEDSPEPSDEDLMEYTREMVKKIIEKCPDLWMVGFRIGESGRREDFFQHSYIAGIKESDREIMMFTRTWLAAPWQVMQIADAYPGRTYIEIKYNGEQLGLPYHAMTTNRRGTAPSYTYENYTDWPRNYKIIWQIRSNGTHRLFRWGDPVFAGRVMKSVQFGAGSGFSMEPMTSYYPMTDYFSRPEAGFDYFKWDHERNWFWYMVWGRLAYNPDETEDVWLGRFNKKFGKGGKDAYDAVVWMSRIVPTIYSWRCLGPDHRNMAPEYETGGSLEDFTGNFPLDPQNIYSIREYVNRYLYNDPMLGVKLDPFRAAGLLDEYAERAAAASDRAKAVVGEDNKEFNSLLIELGMLVHLARYYSNKIRAAAYFEFFSEKSTYPELQWAKKYTADAHAEWDLLSRNGDMYYGQILDTLRIRGQVKKNTFTWSELKQQLDEDARLLAAAADKMKKADGENQKLIVYHVPAYHAPANRELIVSATVVGGSGEKEVTLFYRKKGAGDFKNLEMSRDPSGPSYTAAIAGSEAAGEIEYYIGAAAGDENSRYPGPGSSVRIEPRKYSADEYVDGTAKREQKEREKRIEYEKRRYVTVAFRTESVPPEIHPAPPEVMEGGKKVMIAARVDDASGTGKVVLNYKSMPSGEIWREVEMKAGSEGMFSAVLDLTPSGLLYYFHAADVNSNAAAYPDFLEKTPYLVVDSWDPELNPYGN